jgi:DNA polymerase-1
VLVTKRSFQWAIDGFLDWDRLIVDTETTGLHPWLGDRLCGVSLATPDLSHICYFPFRHEPGGNLPLRYLRALLQLLRRRLLTGWNLKFDLEIMAFDGLPLPDNAEDIMLACHHLDENDQPFELKRWAAKRIDSSAADAEKELAKLLKSRKLKAKEYWKLWPDELEEYACDDVYFTERLRRICIPKLKQWAPPPEAKKSVDAKLWQSPLELWRESNQYMLELAKMEMRGFQLDIPLLEEYNLEAKRNAKKAYRKIAELAGHEINLRSPKQLHVFLKVTSAKKEVLEEMDTPEAQSILTFRAWDKASGTYYEPWLKWSTDDGILHPNLNLHRVRTGRQSASNPNLHATPRYRKEYKVKDLMLARPGYVLISADYNQAELRVGTSVSQEENMAKLFRQNIKVDIHQSVADDLKLTSPDARDVAKTINFMILYGGGAGKLARKLKIPFVDANRYLKRYHAEYWHFRHTSNFWAARARYQGYIRLWTGRVCHFDHPRANPKDAFNSLIQGGVAEMLRIASLRLAKLIPAYDTHMLLQIHDQIIFEAPKSEITKVTPIIKRTMEDFSHWLIPPVVDIKVGKRWSQVKDYEMEKAA